MVTLLKVKAALEEAGVEDAYFEARQIFEYACGTPYETASLRGITAEQEILINGIVKKRQTRYPLQYIFGEWDFMGLRFKTREGVLIPRADTETLVEEALKVFGKGSSILDLCCGSGCIGISMAVLGGCRVTALDKSPDAVKLTKENAALHGADIRVIEADLFDNPLKEKFDGILCNPPYLTSEDMGNLQKEVGFEPQTALFGGEDGLTFYRHITESYAPLINAGGRMFFEIGCTQGKAVADMMKEKYKNVKVIKDPGGNDRVVTGQKEE